MHNEQKAARLDAGVEYRNDDLNCMGSHFKGHPYLDHAHEAPQFPGFDISFEEYAANFNSLNGHDSWNHLQRGVPAYYESKAHGMFDIYTAKRPDRSHTSPGGSPDSGSDSGGGTTLSLGFSNSLESSTEISSTPDDFSSYTTGVTKSRQPRTKSIEDNTLRCTKCPWVGKTPSEQRKHEARHRKDHRCEEDGCEARFGTRNDLERHRKSVHNKCPECGPKETYKCFGRNCGHAEKVWPRLDNFKAHLRLKHSEQNKEDLLSQSRIWYENRKMEEEEKGKKCINVATRKEPPTITPSKTLINTLNHKSGDDFDAVRGNLTLNPIVHPQSLSANISLEHLQSLNELPLSPRRADGSSVDQGDIKLRGVRDILADVDPHKRGDLMPRTRPENTPLNGGLPGVESFDHAVASMKLLDLAAKLQNNRSDLSHKEKKFCLVITSDWSAEVQQDTLKPEEASYEEKAVESAEKTYKMAKEGPKQEGFGCPVCPKSFSRLSALRKHRKRHEKPYGCTFAGCYGRFGSKADWKRHESMQHSLTQSFRCSLPRDSHPQCAKVFLREQDFFEHLKNAHDVEPGTIERQVATGYIGTNDAQSRFTYWCGFCKEIKIVEKTGVDALNKRFAHIDLHFQKSENIKRWVPAKGHTAKGAQKKRDKNRKKQCKRTATSRLEENFGPLYDNGYNDGELSVYEECPSSADETFAEAKSQTGNYGESNKARKLDRVEKEQKEKTEGKEEIPVLYCCDCNKPQPIMAVRCVYCEHPYCSFCRQETAKASDQLLPQTL